MRGQGETRARAGNKGVEQEEGRMGEEKGRENLKGRKGGGAGEVKAQKQIDRTERLLFEMCCRSHRE